jgi:DNA-binding transcriptional MerR regulator
MFQMSQWYVKELGILAGVSVQTLHYYDQINLLKPSVRLANGYRVYSEKDLLKLQQIIALKFCDFELSQIKTLLVQNVDVHEYLSTHVKLLENRLKVLDDTCQALKTIIAGCCHQESASCDWESIIKLIDTYHITKQRKNSQDWQSPNC